MFNFNNTPITQATPDSSSGMARGISIMFNALKKQGYKTRTTPWDERKVWGSQAQYDKLVQDQIAKEKKNKAADIEKKKKSLGLLGLFKSGKERINKETSWTDGKMDTNYVSPMVRGLFESNNSRGGNNSLLGS